MLCGIPISFSLQAPLHIRVAGTQTPPWFSLSLKEVGSPKRCLASRQLVNRNKDRKMVHFNI